MNTSLKYTSTTSHTVENPLGKLIWFSTQGPQVVLFLHFVHVTVKITKLLLVQYFINIINVHLNKVPYVTMSSISLRSLSNKNTYSSFQL